MNTVKFPNITVELSRDTNGNAFAVLAKVKTALRKGGASQEEQEAFFTEATSGDYDHLLQTCMKTVNVT